MSNFSTLPPVNNVNPAGEAPSSVNPAVPNAAPVAGSSSIPLSIELEVNSGPTSKEVAIGSGALLVASLVFFFIRHGYVGWLVGSLKRSPNSASLAGWGLFGFLFFGMAIGCIGLISGSLLTLPIVVPLSALSLVCLVLCIFSSMKR